LSQATPPHFRIFNSFKRKRRQKLTNQLDGGEVLLSAFKDLGVDYIISCPGSEWPPLWEALARQKRDRTDGPVYIDCNHEILAVSLAAAYTQITGRMQIVLLHAGAGLAQGSMAIAASRALETPMLIMSGESIAYGETEFDPGSQWYRNLGVVGGAHRIVEPMVKWAQSIPSYETMYHSVLRAGEMAQRSPKGPTYLCVSMEVLLEQGETPVSRRIAPPAPKQRPIEDDIQRVAALIAGAKRPLILVQTSGPDRATFDALVKLAGTLAIPVFEGAGAFFGNFPKSHEMHLGANPKPFLEQSDLVLLIENATPWYPPSDAPRDTPIVAIGESPLKPHLVYQYLGAHHYLEGDVTETLELLTAAVHRIGADADNIAERRRYWKQHHDRLRAERIDVERQAQAKDVVTVPLLMRSLREMLPEDTTYVDETIVHLRSIHEHVIWDDPHTYFRAPSGLGQGLGYALGVKMALPTRTVVMTIGDGTFMFNPVIAALAFADEFGLPLIIVVLNNLKYGVMEELHNRFYPEGVSRQESDYYGVHLRDVCYEQLAAVVGGYGCRVQRPEELQPAIAAAFDSVKRGKSAVLNIIMPDAVAFK
jgi:acetolactate synthase-1/2/3 large subunit